MPARQVEHRAGNDQRPFLGLSDKREPASLDRAEFPALLNADFSEGVIQKRPGNLRVHSSPLLDASLRLDGVDDYGRIVGGAGYAIPATTAYFGIGVVLNAVPAATCTIFNRGYGAGANIQVRLEYVTATPGWRMSIYDASSAVLRTYSITDGDGVFTPVGGYRYFEWFQQGGNATFQSWDAAGQLNVSATTTKVNGFLATTEDYTLGVSMSASNTIGTDFANATICEFRFSVNTGIGLPLVSAANQFYIRELPYVANLGGYWKLNDCSNAGKLADSAGTNHGFLPNTTAEWVPQTDSGIPMGRSALRFRGGAAWAAITFGAAATVNNVFAAAAPNNSRWTVRFVYTPELLPGQSALSDQMLLWAGTDAANPGPVGCWVQGGQLKARYRDGAANITLTLATNLVVGTRYRIALSRYGAGNGTFYCAMTWWVGGGFNFDSQQGACANAAAGIVSTTWAVARHCTSFTTQTDGTFGTFSTALGPAMTGVIDDLQLVFSNNTTNFPVATGQVSQTIQYAPFGPFTEVLDWTGLQTTNQTVMTVQFNDGSGNRITVLPQTSAALGTTVPATAILYPEVDAGARWDVGYVIPYTAPRIVGMASYDRFLLDGTTRREIVVISGGTAYSVNANTGDVTPIGGGIWKGGQATFAQYAQKLFIAVSNGDRPYVYDGSRLTRLGIAAPLAATVVTVKAAGGTFSGVYYFYVTYRNRDTGEESNAGPGVAVTFAAGNNTVDAMTLPVSADPQVNQRRVYVSLVSGADGSTSYLLDTIDDNSTTNWTTDYGTPPTSGVSLTSSNGFYGRDPAPQAGVVAVFKDRLYLGGNSKFPTRLFYSAVGTPGYFDADPVVGVGFQDVDLDTGRPIVAMTPLLDRLLIHMIDGIAAAWPTGDPTLPVNFTFTNRDHGAVGPQAWAKTNGGVYYIGKWGVYLTDGYSDTDISSPEVIRSQVTLSTASLPSIEHTFYSLNATARNIACGGEFRKRRQLFFAVASTDSARNDTLLVYDAIRRTWSRYLLSVDAMCVEETAANPGALFMGINGFVCRFDGSSFDGVSTYYQGSPSSVSNTFATAGYTTITFAGTPFSGYGTDGLAGCPVYIRDGTLQKRTVVYRNTSSIIYIPISLTTSGTVYVSVGGISFYVDIIADFGNATTKKKLLRFLVSGQSDNAAARVRLLYGLDQNTRSPTFANEASQAWPVADTDEYFHVGGFCRSARFRLSDYGLSVAGLPTEDPFPQQYNIKFHEVRIDAEETAAQ